MKRGIQAGRGRLGRKAEPHRYACQMSRRGLTLGRRPGWVCGATPRDFRHVHSVRGLACPHTRLVPSTGSLLARAAMLTLATLANEAPVSSSPRFRRGARLIRWSARASDVIVDDMTPDAKRATTPRSSRPTRGSAARTPRVKDTGAAGAILQSQCSATIAIRAPSTSSSAPCRTSTRSDGHVVDRARPGTRARFWAALVGARSGARRPRPGD